MYNFHKVKNSQGFHEFKHPVFRRGGHHVLEQIQKKAGDDQNENEARPKKPLCDPNVVSPPPVPVQDITLINQLKQELQKKTVDHQKNINKLLVLLFSIKLDPSLIGNLD